MNDYQKTIWTNGFTSAPARIFGTYGVIGREVHFTMNELAILLGQRLDENNPAQGGPVREAMAAARGLLAGTTDRSEFEDRLDAVVEVIKAA